MSSSSPPSWVKDAVFYQIFPDRFARSGRAGNSLRLEPWNSPPTVHGYKGGDLLGVVERLDLLQELGVSALYFTPIFQSASNHRYHTHDYFRVDPLLGGDEALRELLTAAHQRGMRVVLDGVFNHASRGFFQFSDILENGQQSPYLDWFHVHRFPLNAYGDGRPGYAAWWNLPALPKFNTANPAVRNFLWRVAEYWLEAGIDGWRLDVPNEIDDDGFWQEFRRRCRTVNPDCYLVGEIWGDAGRWLQGDQFDGVMNYPFTRAVLGFVAADLDEAEIARCGLAAIPRLDAAGYAHTVTGLLSRYEKEVNEAQLNLLGSHDTPRVLTMLCEDAQAARMAYLLLMTFPGAPCIYYGDEIGLVGGHDPYCRGTVPWDAPEAWDSALRDWVRRLVELRRQHGALRNGEFVPVHAAGDLLVFARRNADETVMVAVNRGDRQLPLDLTVEECGLGGDYHDSMSGLRLTVAEGRLHGFDVPARRGVIYLAA